jgi:hypothetical protein
LQLCAIDVLSLVDEVAERTRQRLLSLLSILLLRNL